MLFWTLFIQTALIVYLVMIIGAVLSWRARRGEPTAVEGGTNGA
ncbi:hypothetical protein [Amaricoccus macauensis]